MDNKGVVMIAADASKFSNETYYVVVKVTDSGTPHREATVIVRVTFNTVVKFHQDQYHVQVSEAQDVGTIFLTVTALVIILHLSYVIML